MITIIITRENCPECHALKFELSRRGVRFKEWMCSDSVDRTIVPAIIQMKKGRVFRSKTAPTRHDLDGWFGVAK